MSGLNIVFSEKHTVLRNTWQHGSRDNIVLVEASNQAVGWTLEESWFNSRQGQGIYPFFKAYRPFLAST